MPEFAGFVHTAAGAGSDGLVIKLYARNDHAGTSVADTTTNSNGYWAISHGTEGLFDVEVVIDDSNKYRIRYDDQIQCELGEFGQLYLRGTNDAFATKLVSTPTASRTITFPDATATALLGGYANTNTGVMSLTSTANSAAAVYLRANGGTSETIKIHSDQGTSVTEGAESVNILSDAGGVGIRSTANLANAVNITVDGGTTSTMTLFNDQGTAATEGAASIQLLSDVGGINIKSGLNAADAILLTADGGTSEKIRIHADQGTGVDSIELSSDAGGIELNVVSSVGITGSAILDEDGMGSNSAIHLATQQSIKAYVDAQQDTVDTLAEILALSNTTGGTDIIMTDGDDLNFGSGGDIMLRHSGAVSANAEVTTIIAGTSVHPGVAADSLIVSNITASGDMMFATNRGGNTEAHMLFDASAGDTFLYARGVQAMKIAGGGVMTITPALTVTGALTNTAASVLATGTTIGNLTLANGSITDSSGAIDFGNENLTTTGVITAAGFTIGSGAITEAELEILDGASVTTAELNLIDVGTARGTDAIGDGDGVLINDDGTMKMTTVQTLAAYLDDEITAMPNLVTVGTIGTGVWQGTAIASGYIAADAITGAKIADDAIDSEHYTDGSIDNAHIADDAINSEHYAAGSIDTAHIADNQVTLAKMAGIARGKLIYGDSSGNPAVLAVGSANEVLTHDGTDFAWATATGTGLQHASQFRITTGFAGTATPIASNWEEVDTDGYDQLGTAVTESSGLFTFPATGIYYVTWECDVFSDDGQGATTGVTGELQTSVDAGTGDTYDTAARWRTSLYAQGAVNNGYCSFIFDVTSTTTHKVRASITANAGTINGQTAQNRNALTFIKLGDT